MGAEAWAQLTGSLGLGAFLIILWMHFLDLASEWSPPLRGVLFGGLMGGAAIASMSLSVELGPGPLLDMRGVFVVLAGLFGGSLPGVIAAAGALAYRAYLGGSGMVAGCVTIAVYGVVGAAGHYFSQGRASYRHLLAVAFVAPLMGLIARNLLVAPSDMRHIWTNDAIFPGLVGIGILGLGLGLMQARRRYDLVASHAVYRAMVHALPDCLNVKDLDGRFLAANPATAQLMGVADRGDLIGRTDADFYPAEVAERYRTDEAAFLKRGVAVVLDQAVPKADGDMMWVTTLKAPFRTADGRIAGIITHNRDATEGKRLQLLLASAKENLDDALATMADGLALYDTDLKLVFCNRQYLEMFPRSRDLRVAGAYFPDVIREAARRGEYGVIAEPKIAAFVDTTVGHLRTTAQREMEDADGRWLQIRTRPTQDAGALVVVTDISDRKRIEREIEHRATHDALTGLANRALFHARLNEQRDGARHDGMRLAVMLIDLDRFKEVNDTHGHATGDVLLVEVARRLLSTVRDGDLVARFGGDEFAILASGKEGSDFFASLAQRVVERMSEPLVQDGVDLQPSCTIGFTVYPADPGTGEQLLVSADRALYAAKQAGRSTWKLFEPEMTEVVGRSQALAAGVFRAVAQQELDIDYQPIVDVRTLEVIAVEALVRWNHPERGRLSAHEFIHAVENGPAVLPLTRFVLHKALQDQRGWLNRGIGDLAVWVNLAPRCLGWDGFLDTVIGVAAQFEGATNRLVLEVTEGMLMGIDDTETRLAAIRRLGVKIAIDDFGAGYSSLRRLATLPVDVLKIDRMFVTEMVRSPRAAAVVSTIVALGQTLGLTVTAEGVETTEQLAQLREHGCHLAQGHLLGRPMPGTELVRWLDDWRKHRGQAADADLLLRASRQT